jgi:hypothetical protein
VIPLIGTPVHLVLPYQNEAGEKNSLD